MINKDWQNGPHRLIHHIRLMLCTACRLMPSRPWRVRGPWQWMTILFRTLKNRKERWNFNFCNKHNMISPVYHSIKAAWDATCLNKRKKRHHIISLVLKVCSSAGLQWRSANLIHIKLSHMSMSLGRGSQSQHPIIMHRSMLNRASSTVVQGHYTDFLKAAEFIMSCFSII